MITPDTLQDDVRRALAEDVGDGDLTAALIPADRHGEATVISRETAVICGQAWFNAVYQHLDPAVTIHWHVQDGDTVEPDTLLCELGGPARSLVTGERTALNFLQLLSGTTTTARAYAAAVEGTGTRILDTRKTIPGLRQAQKYAVACGGCTNHRHGLFDAILIKENHIMAAGGITGAVAASRRLAPEVTVEVEVENLDELREALDAGADIVLLDNFSLADLRSARAITGNRARLEASGNVDEHGLRAIADTGVDYISVGAITKHLRAVDLSMRFRAV
ncbi:carboxylating nicotinate-nucleotide diphosphorylase [Aquisalimonas sp.]|uniref:carboxylating nicotinate-nucleotide diphosphorylase n=1 Tax=unclassified Aquisalimonas TaxID=2644645 RepID=UPI0025BEB4FD|nr:carboxylating nicotinate-nucleotide diphosphorylase [Aquisalimonas sp.]